MRIVLVTLVLVGLAVGLSRTVSSRPVYVPVHTFDPARDAAADIDAAVAEARRTGRRILLEVGGDWCPWCHSLDALFQAHPDLLQLRDAAFITVGVYYGNDQKNERTLSRYTKVVGIPHCFVLDSDGALLHSQHMLELQTDGNYSPEKMKEFLTKWSPGGDGKKSQP